MVPIVTHEKSVRTRKLDIGERRGWLFKPVLAFVGRLNIPILTGSWSVNVHSNVHNAAADWPND